VTEITILSEYKIKLAEAELRIISCPDCETREFELYTDGRVFCSKCETEIDLNRTLND